MNIDRILLNTLHGPGYRFTKGLTHKFKA